MLIRVISVIRDSDKNGDNYFTHPHLQRHSIVGFIRFRLLNRDSEIAPTKEGTSSESCNYWTIEYLWKHPENTCTVFLNLVKYLNWVKELAQKDNENA